MDEAALDKLLDEPNPQVTRLIKAMNRKLGLPKVLARLGYPTVTQWIEAFPGKTYFELAEVAQLVPGVLMDAHVIEAVEDGRVRQFAMEMLVRQLRHFLAESGWFQTKDEPLELRTVHAAAILQGALRKGCATKIDMDQAKRVWDSLLELSPSIGWVPTDINDSLIQKAFEIGWPETNSSTAGGT